MFPGPNAKKILADRERVYATSTDCSRVLIAGGEGATVTDVDGYRFFDFCCDASVMNLGRGNAKVRDAIINQVNTNIFSEHHHAPNPGAVALAEVLAARSPVKKPTKVFFSNSGTEANEAARKLCESYRYHRGEKTQRTKALYFLNGFAGRTKGSYAATTSKPEVQRDPFWDESAKSHSLYLPYPRRGGDSASFKNELARIDLSHVDWMLMELPCQGEGGVIPVDADALKHLYEETQKAGVLFIADVVQCGMGRIGTLFGCDLFPWLAPDILTMGKALGGGLPIGATLFRADLDWKEGEHSNTFGGGPVVMAAALAAFAETERMLKEGSVKNIEAIVRMALRACAEQFQDVIREVRGVGAMWAVELASTDARNRLIEIGEELVNEEHRGIRLLGAGRTSVRFVPPLVISEDELQEALHIFSKALGRLRAEGFVLVR